MIGLLLVASCLFGVVMFAVAIRSRLDASAARLEPAGDGVEIGWLPGPLDELALRRARRVLLEERAAAEIAAAAGSADESAAG